MRLIQSTFKVSIFFHWSTLYNATMRDCIDRPEVVVTDSDVSRVTRTQAECIQEVHTHSVHRVRDEEVIRYAGHVIVSAVVQHNIDG